jgi:hypothetical protein
MNEDPVYTIRRDGAAWFATRSDFVDLQTSPAGFGETPVDALVDLLREVVPARYAAQSK